MIYGYARVSTEEQCLDRQIDQLVKVGVKEENIYREKMTGTKSKRPKLQAMIDILEEGDTVYIESLSRLGRNSADLLNLLQTFSDRKVALISLKESLDLSSATGKMMAQLLSILSEFERNCLVERVREGLAAARARGRVGGRPATPQKTIDKALQMYNQHNLTVTEICRACGISRPTLYKALRQREEKQELESIDNQ
jgi:DNA invertase Pin-like site-specific DNA recombinase